MTFLSNGERRALLREVADAAFNIHQAKTHLSRLIDRVLDGHEIVIAKAGKPVARLVPFDAMRAHDRVLGTLQTGTAAGTRFDRAVTDDELATIEDISTDEQQCFEGD